MPTLAPSHIVIDDNGVARIDGTRMKVIHLVQAMMSGSSTVDELKEAYPDLTRSQIHAARAYYYDNQSLLDAAIAQESSKAEAARAAAPETPGRKKLRDLGYRP